MDSKKRINSREKGKRGEREGAKLLNDLLDRDDIKRSQQFKGGVDSADLQIDDCSLHPEIKWVDKLNIYEAIEQAERDCNNKVPFVLHKRNYKEPLLTIRAKDLIEFCREILRIKDKK